MGPVGLVVLVWTVGTLLESTKYSQAKLHPYFHAEQLKRETVKQRI